MEIKNEIDFSILMSNITIEIFEHLENILNNNEKITLLETDNLKSLKNYLENCEDSRLYLRKTLSSILYIFSILHKENKYELKDLSDTFYKFLSLESKYLNLPMSLFEINNIEQANNIFDAYFYFYYDFIVNKEDTRLFNNILNIYNKIEEYDLLEHKSTSYIFTPLIICLYDLGLSLQDRELTKKLLKYTKNLESKKDQFLPTITVKTIYN